VILPAPAQGRIEQRFEKAIRVYDPDYVLTPPGGISTEARSLLDSIACYADSLTEARVREHVEGPNRFHFRRGGLAHITQVLLRTYPSGFTDRSNLRVVGSGSPYDFALGLVYGLPSGEYSTFLQRHLRARQLHAPDSFATLLKVLLVAGERTTPRRLSVVNTRSNISRRLFGERELTPLTSLRADRELTLFLFLDDGEEVGLPCSFWNLRRLGPEGNRLFVPKDLFLGDLASSIQTIAAAQPFDELVVVARGSDDESRLVRARIVDALAAAEIDAPVDVYFRDFDVEVPPGTLRVGPPEAMTRSSDSEGLVRFTPPAPFASEIGDTVFGYDAAVEFADGNHLSLPSSPWSSVLLQNPVDRIERAERNERALGRMWLRYGGSPAIRSVPVGIAGVTTPGEECYLHLHPDEVIIEHLLKERGLRVSSNTHTRFAAGFARKFGGIDETLALVRQGGTRIIRALSARRAEASGFSFQQISGFLRERYGVNQAEAAEILKSKLPLLCASGLVRRGVSLTCPHCGLRDWYAMSELGEFMECTGCAQRYQLSGGSLQYSYRANELSKRLIETGGHAVLMTAAGLRRIESAGALQFGGDVFRLAETTNFAELDLILLTGKTLVVGECKDYEVMEEQHVEEIVTSLERSMLAAVALRADVLILGITSAAVHPTLFPACQNFARRVESLELAVHMIVNGELHYECAPTAIDEPALKLEHLMQQRPASTAGTSHVGSLRASIGFGFSRGGSSETIERWETALGI
jgi:hypothetical protein